MLVAIVILKIATENFHWTGYRTTFGKLVTSEECPDSFSILFETDGESLEDGVAGERQHGQEVPEAARLEVDVRVTVGVGMVVDRELDGHGMASAVLYLIKNNNRIEFYV